MWCLLLIILFPNLHTFSNILRTHVIAWLQLLETWNSITTRRYLSKYVFYRKIWLVPLPLKLHLWNLCSPWGCCALTVAVQGYFRRIWVLKNSWALTKKKKNLAKKKLHNNTHSTTRQLWGHTRNKFWLVNFFLKACPWIQIVAAMKSKSSG